MGKRRMSRGEGGFSLSSLLFRAFLSAALSLAFLPAVPLSASAEDADASTDDALPVAVSKDEAGASEEDAVVEDGSFEGVEIEGVMDDVDFSSLPDSDELAEGYIESVLYDGVGSDESSGSTLSLMADYGEECLSGDDLTIYRGMVEFAESVASEGGSTVYSYECDYTGVGSISTVASRYYSSLDMDTVFSSLLVDCPYDLYWFDKTVGIVSPTVSGSIDGRYVTVESINFKFTPSSDYIGSGEYTVDETKARATSKAAYNAACIVGEYGAETSVEAKLTAYKDEICALVDYDDDVEDDDDYGDPWQLVYVFDGDSSTDVVCEGYAKAFQYLCDLTWPDNDPVTCYTVTGTLSGGTGEGGHMWNLVTVDDEEEGEEEESAQSGSSSYGPVGSRGNYTSGSRNSSMDSSSTDEEGSSYLVDLTNSDEGAVGSKGGLFLVGADEALGNVDVGYTFTVSKNAVKYEYDDDAFDLYDRSILTLASEKFSDVEVEPSYLVAIPAANQGLVYNRTTQTGLSDGELYTVASGGTGKDAGTYTAVLSLKDKDTYTWVGTQSSDDVEVTWSISPASLSSATVALGKKTFVYNGKTKKPRVKSVKLKGVTLSAGSEYKVSHGGGHKKIGSYTVTVSGTGNYTGSVKATYTIEPKATRVKKATAGKRKVTVKVAKRGGDVKYQIRYRAKGKKKWRTVTVKKTGKTFDKLKKGKKYQFKVRTRKKVKGVVYTSKWSKTKTSGKVL